MRRVLLPLVAAALLLAASPASDPIAAEIARLSAILKTPAGAPLEQVMAPVLARSEQALQKGRRNLALQRLAAAWPAVEGAAFAKEHEKADFEQEWKRSAAAVRVAQPLAAIEPAALRALAEAATSQARVLYHASLDYGRADGAASGLHYIGEARAQKAFVDLARRLSQPGGRRAPAIQSLQFDTLERELLAAYRPPAALDRHSEFIGASAAIKEARELDAAGLRYGALQRYLEAARRVGQLTGAPMERVTLESSLRELEARLRAGGVDHSIGQTYAEAAESDLEGTAPPAIATAIVTHVLPRYFAALEPAAKEGPRPAPRTTITLVRWPFT